MVLEYCTSRCGSMLGPSSLPLALAGGDELWQAPAAKTMIRRRNRPRIDCPIVLTGRWIPSGLLPARVDLFGERPAVGDQPVVFLLQPGAAHLVGQRHRVHLNVFPAAQESRVEKG